tara:strand:- start:4683 stop:5921 length:1239 start_codon:yes stop_codon:yes gene_type:complete
MKKLKPLDFDLNQKDIGTYELPPEIAHLEEYKKYAKPIKEGVWGFFIPQFTKTGANNEDWYTFRYHTLGASSVATLTDHDEYGDPVKMFWEKIGMSTPKIYSKFMTAGSHFESGIADLWDFNDGTDDGWAEIWSSGKKVRQKAEIPCYAINLDYPHLSASLDYLALGGQKSPFTGEVINFDFGIEVKNISYFAAQKYNGGIPVRYVFQLHQQMLVTNTTYAEIASLTGGFDSKVTPFEMDFDICQDLIIKSYDFWKRVEAARPIYAELKPLEDKLASMSSAQQNSDQGEDLKLLIGELDRKIYELEPEPSANEAYKEWYTSRYKETLEDASRLGTQDEWDQAVRYKVINDTIKDLKAEQDGIKNKLLSSTRYDSTVEFGDEGSNGRILSKKFWDVKKEEYKSTFRVNIKNYK